MPVPVPVTALALAALVPIGEVVAPPLATANAPPLPTPVRDTAAEALDGRDNLYEGADVWMLPGGAIRWWLAACGVPPLCLLEPTDEALRGWLGLLGGPAGDEESCSTTLLPCAARGEACEEPSADTPHPPIAVPAVPLALPGACRGSELHVMKLGLLPQTVAA